MTNEELPLRYDKSSRRAWKSKSVTLPSAGDVEINIAEFKIYHHLWSGDRVEKSRLLSSRVKVVVPAVGRFPPQPPSSRTLPSRQGKLFSLSVQELVSCVPNPEECGGEGGSTGFTAELA
eukprot:scaffold1561_cov129-Cylindrotheca_fusiformis.AAC.3